MTGAAAGRRPVRTFDFVDTLVARRCGEPFAIFEQVERASGIPGLATARQAAEQAIYDGPEYDLDDIYRELANRTGLRPDQARALRALEIAIERDNFIPIRRNCAAVRPGDVVVSDMYLPAEVIRQVLAETCGLPLNPVIVSSHGKSRGHGWRRLAAAMPIAEHLGDNPHADIAMAAAAGIPARLTTAARPTAPERRLEAMGLPGLARAVREARLASFHPDPALDRLAQAQIGYNLPLIVVAALLLADLARERGWRRLLFSSRDCFLLRHAFVALAATMPNPPETVYFHTSRVARCYPSPGTLAYLGTLLDGGTAIVDLCGTGWSLSRLLDAAKRPDLPLVILHHMRNPDLLAAYGELDRGGINNRVDSLIGDGDNVVLEAFNGAPHPMVEDIVAVGDSFVPILAPDEGPRIDQLATTSEEAFRIGLAAVLRAGPDEIARWRAAATRAGATELYTALGTQSGAVRELIEHQVGGNGAVMETLRAKRATAGNGAAG